MSTAFLSCWVVFSAFIALSSATISMWRPPKTPPRSLIMLATKSMPSLVSRPTAAIGPENGSISPMRIGSAASADHDNKAAASHAATAGISLFRNTSSSLGRLGDALGRRILATIATRAAPKGLVRGHRLATSIQVRYPSGAEPGPQR